MSISSSKEKVTTIKGKEKKMQEKQSIVKI